MLNRTVDAMQKMKHVTREPGYLDGMLEVVGGRDASEEAGGCRGGWVAATEAATL